MSFRRVRVIPVSVAAAALLALGVGPVHADGNGGTQVEICKYYSNPTYGSVAGYNQ